MSQSTLDTLTSRFDPQAASGMDEVFQFHFDDAESHYLVIQDESLSVEQGEHDAPSVSLTMSTATLKGLMTGEVNGMTAFMTGKLKATGNVMLATKLTSLFPGE
ncbi:SCP2 sterol-binding domain-containing protein [Halomonas icarae]|uniref:SCP-2 family sterol carrier protein n=1 Tax=Halomonas icarae TaxID=2691040 RepID=A0A7X4W063_9GAMM|nr:SCP2 sterol-binding domain-containing protein [Halomonas icarae]MDR5902052.1 SCP2 sterol-binding domain-containing protein [Halomonas icarae]NAW12248.1 SCP-2 family sterol carrier protein [Halomonas icarae]